MVRLSECSQVTTELIAMATRAIVEVQFTSWGVRYM